MYRRLAAFYIDSLSLMYICFGCVCVCVWVNVLVRSHFVRKLTLT